MSDQPAQKRSKASKPVAGVADNEFCMVSAEQVVKGFARYHALLTTFNGRDPHADALAELVDAVHYVTQARMERDEIVRRAAEMAKAARGLIATIERWEAATAVVIGRVPHHYIELDEARAALAAWDELGLEVKP